MKLQKYATDKDNSAVKGNLTAEEIVRADWERNYKKSGVPLGAAKMAVKRHVDDGGDVFRMRNTIILLTSNDDYEDVEFHTITADPQEVYQVTMLMFLLGLNKAKGTQTAVTYVDDKRAYRMASKMLGKDYVDIETSNDADQGKYALTLDLDGLASNLQREAATQGAR